MATPILRTIDRWRFETPLALALAAAAGFAVMAMPHPLFAQIPMVADHGRAGHAALAVVAALVCGGLGYLAMRRPAKHAPVAEDEDIEDLYAPVHSPAASTVEDEPLRLRRADRHPDAPPRAPIRASRDLGEPFMEVGTPVTPSVEQTFGEHEPVEAEHRESAAFETERPAEAEPASIEHEPVVVEPVTEEAIEHPLEAAAEPAAAEAVVEAPVAEAPLAEVPAIIEAPLAPAPRPLSSATRDDASISAMMDRLSAGLQRRTEAVGRPIGAARQSSPALRDALDELNRLAERRG